MPAAAWAARSGDPVLFADRNKLPAATAAALKRAPQDAGLRPRPDLGDLPCRGAKDRQDRQPGPPRLRSGPGDERDRPRPLWEGSFGWNVNEPGHGFVVARSDSPLDAAAAAPLSASGTWGPLLLTDNAARLPSALRGYLLDVKPGYTTDPTRAFYNHVWVIGDEGAIDVNQQAEIRQPCGADQDRGRTVSEAESPELLSRPATRSRPRTISALAGASTPHFALQVRNRIRRLIEPLPPGHPARIEGERKIAELEDLAEHSGDPRGTLGIAH